MTDEKDKSGIKIGILPPEAAASGEQQGFGPMGMAPGVAEAPIPHEALGLEVQQVTGAIKWFDVSKGYGFIVPDDGTEDVFVHYKNIKMEGYKSLKRDEGVNYELVTGDRGVYAENVSSTGVIEETEPQEAEEQTEAAEEEEEDVSDLVF